MAIAGSCSGFSASAIVSPISNCSKPITAQISPASTCSTFLRMRPSKIFNSLILCLIIFPSLFTKETTIPALKTPRCNLPIAIRPV